MDKVELVTVDDEKFTVLYDAGRRPPGQIICVIGDKIISFYKRELFVFDIIEYRSRSDREIDSSLRRLCRQTRIARPISNGGGDVQVMFLSVASRSSDTNAPATKETICLYDNSISLGYRRLSNVYVDILSIASMDLSILLTNKLDLFSYGIVVSDDGAAKIASRLVTSLSQQSIRFIFDNEKNISLINVRFDVDYRKAGSVVLFNNAGGLVYYFQCVCCKNTNQTIKHLLPRSVGDAIPKRKAV